MGIDPGLINTGFGIIALNKSKLKILDYGIISPLKTDSLSMRLNTIFNDVSNLISDYKPDCLSVEEVFYNNNVKTTMKLGQARGAVLIAAAQFDISIYEYSARKIKLSLTGNGNSHKSQVRFMVEKTLNINMSDIENDASDALAAAICHEQQFRISDL